MILIGTKCQLEAVVTEELTAAAAGSGLLPVFGTPFMIALMENCSASLLQNFLEGDQGSVGIHHGSPRWRGLPHTLLGKRRGRTVPPPLQDRARL